MKSTLILGIFNLLTVSTFAQPLSQTIKGIVIDKDSRIPLPGATVMIMESDPVIGTFTDSEGKFVFKDIHVGRTLFGSVIWGMIHL